MKAAAGASGRHRLQQTLCIAQLTTSREVDVVAAEAMRKAVSAVHDERAWRVIARAVGRHHPLAA